MFLALFLEVQKITMHHDAVWCGDPQLACS